MPEQAPAFRIVPEDTGVSGIAAYAILAHCSGKDERVATCGSRADAEWMVTMFERAAST